MKKAKIALSAIAILAVIGGAFAFKANRGAGNLFKPGITFTTAVGGPVYYSSNVILADHTTTNVGVTSFYYTSATILAGKTALVGPTLRTRATFVGQ